MAENVHWAAPASQAGNAPFDTQVGREECIQGVSGAWGTYTVCCPWGCISYPVTVEGVS